MPDITTTARSESWERVPTTELHRLRWIERRAREVAAFQPDRSTDLDLADRITYEARYILGELGDSAPRSGTRPEPTSDTRHYEVDLRRAGVLNAVAAEAVQLLALNPLGTEPIDAARLAEIRQGIHADIDPTLADRTPPTPRWDELSDEQRTEATIAALPYLRAARSIGFTR